MSSSMLAARRAAQENRHVDAWLDAIKEAADVGRFASGFVAFRTGQVQDVRVEAGAVRGQIEGSRGALYEAVIRVTPYGASEWRNAEGLVLPGLDPIGHLTPTQAITQLDKRFSHLGLQTFAQKLRSSVQAECTCRDHKAFCKHAAALAHAFGEMLRRDPTALVTLLGGSPEQWGIGSADEHAAGLDETGIPLVLLPEDAERNLQDRSLDELVHRYWRPIREIRFDRLDAARQIGLGQSDVDSKSPDRAKLPMGDLSDFPFRDTEEVAQVLKNMYALIRERANEALRLGVSKRSDSYK